MSIYNIISSTVDKKGISWSSGTPLEEPITAKELILNPNINIKQSINESAFLIIIPSLFIFLGGIIT